jgi:hypothetical protein
MQKEEIFSQIIGPALEIASATMPGIDLKKLTPDLILYGASGAILDSINLVSFIFILEETLKNVLGREFRITAQDMFGRVRNPFSSLTELTDFIDSQLAAPEKRT